MSGRGFRIIICVGVLIIALWQPGDARGDTQQKPRVERDHPIQIVSDRLDAYHEKRMVVFSGNAVATQGARTIRSDRLTLYYKEDKKTAGGSTREVEGTEIWKGGGQGHVTSPKATGS